MSLTSTRTLLAILNRAGFRGAGDDFVMRGTKIIFDVDDTEVELDLSGGVLKVNGVAGGGGGAASTVTFDNSGTLLPSTNVQSAISFLSRRGIYANDFGAVADGTSHPLSETYATLGAALVAYPAALALTDEKDWCAIQAASNYIYARDLAINGGTINYSAGHIVFDGQYLINRTCTFNHHYITLTGASRANRDQNAGATSIKWNGSAGTSSAPVDMFDLYMVDEFGNPPAGRYGNALQQHVGFEISGITFCGPQLGTHSSSPATIGYVRAIRMRGAYGSSIHRCTFKGMLMDAIVATGACQLIWIYENRFYGVHRDAIAFLEFYNNFSTTQHIFRNDCGSVGRYQILLAAGSHTNLSVPIIQNNIHQSTGAAGYYLAHPEHWVGGVISTTCVMGGAGLTYEKGYYESTAGTVTQVVCDLHLISISGARVRDSNMAGILCSGLSAASEHTAAATTFLAANGYLDVNDQRNYNINTAADQQGTVSALQLENLPALQLLANVEGVGLPSGSSKNTMRNVATASGGVVYGRFDTTTRTLDDASTHTIIIPVTTAAARPAQLQPNWSLFSSFVTQAGGLNQWQAGYNNYIAYSNEAGAGGTYILRSLNSLITVWSNGMTLTAVGYRFQSYVRPTVDNGFLYQVTTGGTGGGSEPTWPTVVGNTVTTNGCVITCRGRLALNAEDSIFERVENGKRHRTASATPAAGTFAVGDKITNTAPAAGGAGIDSWRCTTAPNTWTALTLD